MGGQYIILKKKLISVTEKGTGTKCQIYMQKYPRFNNLKGTRTKFTT